MRALRAGLVAACCQLAALLAVTLIVWFFELHNLLGQETRIIPNEEPFCFQHSSLLTLTYLIFAIGFSFSESKSASLSADCFRRRKMSREELEAVMVQFGIPAILLAGLAFAPPDMILDLGGQFATACLIRLGWAAVMSVCVAFCGASAHAAYRAKS
jgi:hypothetical protein